MKSNSILLQESFPLHAVRDGVILSKGGDFTVGWELFLPTVYTASESIYDSIVSSLSAAIRMLPDGSIVHKQDTFFQRRWKASSLEQPYLERKHSDFFDGRPYLEHRSYIFLTIPSTKRGKRRGFDFFRNNHATSSSWDKDLTRFQSYARRFMGTIQNVEGLRVIQLKDGDYLGEGTHPGILQRFLMLGSDSQSMGDIALTPSSVKVEDRVLTTYTVCEDGDLPSELKSFTRIGRLCMESGDIVASGGYHYGLGLDKEHIVNQYFMTVGQGKFLRYLDSRKARMRSMERISPENAMHADEIEAYRKAAGTGNVTVCNSHLNVMVLSKDGDDFAEAINATLSRFVSANLTAVHNTSDTPCLFFSALPGAEAELGDEEYMPMELESALCLGCYDTFDTGFGSGNITLCDRDRLIPLRLDIGDMAASMGHISNYNMVIVGSSGAGKSFTCNCLLYQLYHQGYDIVLMDKGDSYEGICGIIQEESGNLDGKYYSWNPEHPLAFNPFEGCFHWDEVPTDDINTGRTILMAILQTIWQPGGNPWSPAVTNIVEQTISDFLGVYCPKMDLSVPVFGDYVKFLSIIVQPAIQKGAYTCGDTAVTPDNIDITDFCLSLRKYGFGGALEYLLNSRTPSEVMSSRFSVFEVDQVSSMDDVYPIWLLCIMRTFERKMRNKEGRKMLVIEEAWKAIRSEATSSYKEWLWRTSRKFNTTAALVTQQASDLTSSEVIKGAILHNSDIKIILDPASEKNTFGEMARMLGLTKNETDLVLSINNDLRPDFRYKEIFLSLGGKKYGVYAVLVSPEEAIVYESNKDRKREYLEEVKRTGSPIRAIDNLITRHSS